jgi:hypothetical protein
MPNRSCHAATRKRIVTQQIGANIRLFRISQNKNITYKLKDGALNFKHFSGFKLCF